MTYAPYDINDPKDRLARIRYHGHTLIKRREELGESGIYLAFVKEDLSSLEYAYSLLATVCFIYNKDYSKIADILNERTEI